MVTLALFGGAILHYFVGLLLLCAAVAKLRTLDSFGANLTQSFGVNGAHSRALALALTLVELWLAVLVLGAATRAGMWGALIMFCLFTAVLGYKFYTQSVVRCGCFGEAERTLSGFDLVRNCMVIAAICAGLMLGSASLPLTAALLAGALAGVACVVAMHFHEMASLLVTSHG